jgi:arsenate reductase
MMKKKVLFICVRNTARSQMAEALFNRSCEPGFEAHSAGLDPGSVNPLAIEVMQEIGLDISGQQTKTVFDMFRSGRSFLHVVTIHDEASHERPPIFPGVTNRSRWHIPDPALFRGSHEERLARTREVRDVLRAKIEEWCAELSPAVMA